MGYEASYLEDVIHLVLFVAAGLTLALSAFVGVELLADSGRRMIGLRILAGAWAFTILCFVAERLYHLM